MVIATRPDHAVQVAFNADPNDPAAVPTFVDLTNLLLGASGIKRGKQLELDQVEASQPTLDFLDPNEYLNPANGSSPYSPNVVPLRQALWQCVWPNTTAGNLLPGQLSPAVDPSFESYTNGQSLSWVLTVGSGVAPTVTTTNPQQGTKSLTYAATAGTGTNGIGLTITCIPGRQYTASLYLRQTAANTNLIFINGGAAGSSTSTTGAYVRLSVTFTATQPTHQLWVTSSSTSLSGTVNVDAIQLEQGGSLNAFTMSGPVIYPVLRDYVEEWPAEWEQDSEGFLGLCSTTCVDAFAVLAGTDLWGEYRNAVMAKAPTYYWPLNEPQGSTTFAEVSGNNGPPLVRLDGKYGAAATFAPGTQTGIVGDSGGTGIKINAGGSAINTATTIVQTGQAGTLTPLVTLGGALPWTVTWAFWLTHDVPAGGNLSACEGSDQTFSNTHILFQVTPTNLTFNSLSVADTWKDGKPHLIIGSRNLQSGQFTDTLWVDGVQVATSTTVASGWRDPTTMTLVEFGGDIGINFTKPGPPNAVYAHAAIWNRALSAPEIADLWNAGKGYPGETSGARITRYLGYGWTGTSAIDTGQSVMGASNLASSSTSLLAACQSVTTSENGNLFVDAKGTVTFQARTRRYLATTPAYVFGQNVAGGEIPYEGDIKFGFDRLQIYNQVNITNVGAAGASVSDATSKKRFFPNTYQRQVNVSAAEATDAANYILAGHRNPVQRVERITLDPGANPSLWPVVLSLELGTRVTAKKVSKAANGGTGLTQQADFFVESIEHTDIDLEAGTWKTVLLLSPAAAALQPWILGDATYGLLNQTTVLGY